MLGLHSMCRELLADPAHRIFFAQAVLLRQWEEPPAIGSF